MVCFYVYVILVEQRSARLGILTVEERHIRCFFEADILRCYYLQL